MRAVGASADGFAEGNATLRAPRSTTRLQPALWHTSTCRAGPRPPRSLARARMRRPCRPRRHCPRHRRHRRHRPHCTTRRPRRRHPRRHRSLPPAGAPARRHSTTRRSSIRALSAARTRRSSTRRPRSRALRRPSTPTSAPAGARLASASPLLPRSPATSGSHAAGAAAARAARPRTALRPTRLTSAAASGRRFAEVRGASAARAVLLRCQVLTPTFCPAAPAAS